MQSKSTRIERICQNCSKIFLATPSDIARGWAKYCNQICRNETNLPENRFWKRVRKTDTCWVWTGTLNNKGYGEFNLKIPKKNVTTHRFSWILHNGPIPDGLCVLHKCDNPPCVNPAHLFLGTQIDNIHDMHKKGRNNQPKGIRVNTAKLTESQVTEIRTRYASGGVTQVQLADEFGIHQTGISYIILHKTWKHIA